MVTSAVVLRTFLLGLISPWGSCQVLPFPYPGAGAFFGNSYNRPEAYRLLSVEHRLSALEKRVTGLQQDIDSRLRDVEKLLTALARQECQTNEVIIELCPSFREASMNDIVNCVVSPISGAQMVNITRHVLFSPRFLFPPILSVNLNAQAMVSGKNCSIQVTSETPEGFTFTFIADDFLPVETRIVWYACPAALFTQEQILPGGLRGHPISGTASGKVFRGK